MDYMIGILLLFMILSINSLQSSINRLNQKLNKIANHIGLEETSLLNIKPELKNELLDLVNQIKKVKAIKRLRDATGVELIEAKEYVDKL